jgi:hypothetical protein
MSTGLALVISNKDPLIMVDGQWQYTPETSMALPDGQIIPAATPGDQLRYFREAMDGHWFEVRTAQATTWIEVVRQQHAGVMTIDQAFAVDLMLHKEFGTAIGDEAAGQYHITLDALRAAVMATPAVLDYVVTKGYTEAEVWGWVQHEAPMVALVGVA